MMSDAKAKASNMMNDAKSKVTDTFNDAADTVTQTIYAIRTAATRVALRVNGSLPPCSHSLEPTPKCVKKCQDSYTTAYPKDKHFGTKAYTVDSDVQAIQKEIK